MGRRKAGVTAEFSEKRELLAQRARRQELAEGDGAGSTTGPESPPCEL